jgi:ubiquinone/menaquinone biosynthesis C-methylase UbiE
MEKYPNLIFKISDATKLDFKSKSFDIILSGSCILHIVEYEKAITEAARVTKNFVIFSRTPIIHLTETTFVTKRAYDQEMLEIVFNETELINLFSKNKLGVISTKVLSSFWIRGISEPVYVKSYLCQKL